jgi:hypothetical protein
MPCGLRRNRQTPANAIETDKDHWLVFERCHDVALGREGQAFVECEWEYCQNPEKHISDLLRLLVDRPYVK